MKASFASRRTPVITQISIACSSIISQNAFYQSSRILCSKYRAFSYIPDKHQMHLIKYSKMQFIKYNSWLMFRHRSALFRQSIETKEHKSNTPIQVLVFLSFIRLPEKGTPLPKHVEVILTMNCILLGAFGG
jgi:hypothetical protein